uniref:Small ribosomal subunit protein mS29 n=1 Tax=Plectus sambesii TaxID=2011161 RepID=A0A914UXF8_9BILA
MNAARRSTALLIGASRTRFASLRTCSTQTLRTYRASTNDPGDLAISDVGKFYEVAPEALDHLQFKRNLTKEQRKQYDTLGEYLWMCRRPYLEAVNCLQAVRPSFPSLNVVLWGKFGTGKSMTLFQLTHYAYSQGWVVLHVHNVLKWTRGRDEIAMSAYKPGRIDTPIAAQALLSEFKSMNTPNWSKLSECKTERAYEWSKVETTAKGSPITDIVDMGITTPHLATDCFGALVEELKRHASDSKFKLLVTIDHGNSIFHSTKVKRADATYAPAMDLSINQQLVKFAHNDWSNGACVLVVDKKEFYPSHDLLVVPVDTPLELLGEKGFEVLDPFIPIETTLYSMDEAEAAYSYYYDKRWITSDKGRSSDGKKELLYISAFNPYMFERMCAIV